MRGARLLSILVPALAGVAPAHAVDAPLDLAVKATYLPKFAPYVSWPPSAFASPGDPLQICVVGTDPFGQILDQAVAGQQANGRAIAVRRLDRIGRGSGCNIAYLGGSTQQPTSEALRVLQGSRVLTVTDAARDSRARGIVHFEVRARRVRFHINDRLAAAGEIDISSKLLDLALTVKPRAR